MVKVADGEADVHTAQVPTEQTQTRASDSMTDSSMFDSTDRAIETKIQAISESTDLLQPVDTAPSRHGYVCTSIDDLLFVIMLMLMRFTVLYFSIRNFLLIIFSLIFPDLHFVTPKKF